MELGIVGVGAIAEAIVDGLGPDATTHLSPRNAARAAALAARHATAHIARSNQAVLDRAGVVLVCVRPQDGPTVLRELAFRPEHTVLSAMAGISVEAVRELVAPATTVVRAIPMPAVARRAGVTAIHPDNAVARAVFDPLGGALALEDERAFSSISVATATIAAHMTYLDTITRWLAARGIPHADATRYVAEMFAALRFHDDFGALAKEHATLGGINEQFAETLRRAGVFEAVDGALDDIARRVEG